MKFDAASWKRCFFIPPTFKSGRRLPACRLKLLGYFACMWSVCKKELRQFFSSLTGYIAIIVFLLVNGLALFVFRDNIFEFGYATLDRFFSAGTLGAAPAHPCDYHAQFFRRI